MNVISNNCVGAYFYRKNNMQFNNPFMWIGCHGDVFYELIHDYAKINFFNYDLCREQNSWNFYIIIDDKIEVRFRHAVFDPTCTSIVKEVPNVKYCRIWEYICQTYEKRLKRMLESNEQPIFLMDWWGTYLKEHKNWIKSKQTNEVDYFNEFLCRDFPYKTIILQPYIKENKEIKNNLHVIYDKNIYFNNGDPCGLIERHNNEILSIIKSDYE